MPGKYLSGLRQGSLNLDTLRMSDKPKETKPDEEETSPPVPELVDLRDEVEIYCDGRSAPDDKDDDGLSSNDEEEFLDALDREVR